jgi:hypothetical protein
VPTHRELPRFLRDWRRLPAEGRDAFLATLELFVTGLEEGRFDPRLRVKRVQGHAGVWEMTWAPDGRATFHYGDEIRPGDPHIIWRRIGTHAIFRAP